MDIESNISHTEGLIPQDKSPVQADFLEAYNKVNTDLPFAFFTYPFSEEECDLFHKIDIEEVKDADRLLLLDKHYPEEFIRKTAGLLREISEKNENIARDVATITANFFSSLLPQEHTALIYIYTQPNSQIDWTTIVNLQEFLENLQQSCLEISKNHKIDLRCDSENNYSLMNSNHTNKAISFTLKGEGFGFSKTPVQYRNQMLNEPFNTQHLDFVSPSKKQGSVFTTSIENGALISAPTTSLPSLNIIAFFGNPAKLETLYNYAELLHLYDVNPTDTDQNKLCAFFNACAPLYTVPGKD